ncbi:MAG TPA: PAS domain S-box protein, partial [Geobacteraceae bacterium]|nr:PAS domain S-box protein [Geobacteraceae bacterium]
MGKVKLEILLIEDNLAEATLIKRILAESQREEFSVEHVQYLADGIDLLKKRSFACVLVDLGLPDSQGLETALAVRNQVKQKPIAIIAIFDDEEMALKALQMDIQDFLVKEEINSSLLVRSIRCAIERKHFAENLRKSEERFALFMLHMPAAAWIKDLKGRYVYANAEAERIFATQLPDLQGKSDSQIFPPETARQFRKNDRRALTRGGNLQTIEVLRQTDGIEHHSMVSKFAIPSPDGRPLYVAGVAFDITERKQAEKEIEQLSADLAARNYELNKSNQELEIHKVELEAQNEELRLAQRETEKLREKYQDLYEFAPVGYFTLDKRGVILEANLTCAYLLGHEREIITGCPLVDFLSPGSWPEFKAFRESVLASEELQKCEVHLKDREGAGWVLVEGIKSGCGKESESCRMALIDISERKRVEEALKENEKRFRALVTASSQVLYRMSPDWSEMRELYSRGFLAGTEEPNATWLDKYIHPDDQPRVTAIIRQAINSKSMFELEHRVRRADGRLAWMLSRAVPLLDNRDEIVEWFGVASDI